MLVRHDPTLSRHDLNVFWKEWSFVLTNGVSFWQVGYVFSYEMQVFGKEMYLLLHEVTLFLVGVGLDGRVQGAGLFRWLGNRVRKSVFAGLPSHQREH